MITNLYELANGVKEITAVKLKEENITIDKKCLDEAVEYAFLDCVDYLVLLATMEYFLAKNNQKKCIKYNKKLNKHQPCLTILNKPKY